MKEFRIALAGCGSMSNAWVKYIQTLDDARIVALVDLYELPAKKMADTYGLDAAWYTDLALAIRETGANLVCDVTIPDAHRAIVSTALTAGCDVLGEKPMASTMTDALALVQLAAGTGKSYAVMQNRRFLKNIRALRQMLMDGVIGQPGFYMADFFLAPHFGGFRDAMDSPLVLDMAIHTFDAARFLVGADPVSVYCQEFNPPGSWYRGDAAAVAIFEFADGAVFCYRGSWCAEGARTSWESSWRITGSQGTAIWDGTEAPYAEVIAPPPPGEPEPEPVNGRPGRFMNEHRRVEATFPWQGVDGHNGCFAEMFAALREGRKAETDCSDNIKSMAMVHAALQSSREGRKIPIDIS